MKALFVLFLTVGIICPALSQTTVRYKITAQPPDHDLDTTTLVTKLGESEDLTYQEMFDDVQEYTGMKLITSSNMGEVLKKKLKQKRSSVRLSS